MRSIAITRVIICLLRTHMTIVKWNGAKRRCSGKGTRCNIQSALTHTKAPLYNLQTCALTPDLVRWWQPNAKVCVCALCVCVWRLDLRKGWASKITFIVQGGHPENIFERGGTFLEQEDLPGEGKARLWHTHTHAPRAKVEACEPEMGACLPGAGRRIQKVQRDPTCRRSQPIPSSTTEVCTLSAASWRHRSPLSTAKHVCHCVCVSAHVTDNDASRITHTHTLTHIQSDNPGWAVV